MAIFVPVPDSELVGVLHLRWNRIRITHRGCVPDGERTHVEVIFRCDAAGPCYYCGRSRMLQPAERPYTKPVRSAAGL